MAVLSQSDRDLVMRRVLNPEDGVKLWPSGWITRAVKAAYAVIDDALDVLITQVINGTVATNEREAVQGLLGVMAALKDPVSDALLSPLPQLITWYGNTRTAAAATALAVANTKVTATAALAALPNPTPAVVRRAAAAVEQRDVIALGLPSQAFALMVEFSLRARLGELVEGVGNV